MSRPPSDPPADARLDALWREASREDPPAAPDDAIRAAARHDFPTADIEQMLAEIARGYEDTTRA